jgi:O-methyltransferase
MSDQSGRSPLEPSISVRVATTPVPSSPSELYLDLLKRVLTRTIVARSRERHALRPAVASRRLLHRVLGSVLDPLNLELVRVVPGGPNDYIESGHAACNRAEDAETMVGTKQLDNLQACVTNVVQNGVPGDVLEAGVWRGGMPILMRAVLKVIGDSTRKVWVVDSFAGLPQPDRTHDSFGWRAGDMAVSLDEVRGNFAKYGLLDDQVSFLKGFFCDTLPTAPIPALSILRIDADLYESTKDVLIHLYPRLSPGGFAIFDDYLNLKDCRRAVDEYRAAHAITDEIHAIDTRAVYWQKSVA